MRVVIGIRKLFRKDLPELRRVGWASAPLPFKQFGWEYLLRGSAAPCFRTMSPCFAFGASPRIFTPLFASAGATRPANVPAPPTPGIVALRLACFLINMIPGHNGIVCARTFESLRLVHNFSIEPTSELAMNPHEDSVPFGPYEPLFRCAGSGLNCFRNRGLQRGGCGSGGDTVSGSRPSPALNDCVLCHSQPEARPGSS